MKTIYYWSDGTWCHHYQLESYLTFKSRYFKRTKTVLHNDDEIDKLVAKLLLISQV